MSTRKLQIVAAIICGILLLAGATPAWAAQEAPDSPAAPDAVPPLLLSYQGTLRDSSGNPDNGTHTMTAAIYDNAAGSGSPLWGPETHSNVQVRNGHFSLLLGNGSPAVAIPADLFSAATRYLKLTVDGNALTPGQRLASVPYAISSNYANSLAAPDGAPLAAVTVDNSGNTSMTANLSVAGTATVSGDTTLSGNASVAGNTTVGGALSFGSSVRQMVNLWSTTYAIGVQSSTEYFRSDGNFAWYKGGTHSNTALDPGTGGTAQMVLTSSGNLGIGDTTPGAKLDVNGDVFVTGHKPIIFRQYTSTGSCYHHWWGAYSDTEWTCGIVSYKVNVDINENDKQYPALRVESYTNGGSWHFYVDATDSCNEDWEITVMCVDNNLVQWDSAVPTN